MKNKIAKILLTIAGLFPLCVGIYYYLFFMNFPVFRFMEHIAFTNLISTGVVTLTLIWNNPIPVKKWIFLLLLFIIIWTSGNDSYALLRQYYFSKLIFPFAIIPLLAGSVGLGLLASEVKNE
jgi:hypothetical protein